jgi:hypothetical protein
MAEPTSTRFHLPESNFDMGETHIPRPSNAWILFRTAFNKQNRTRSLTDISKGASEEWKAMKDRGQGEQDVWKQLAKEEKLAHRKNHPHYKFTPVIKDKKVGGKKIKKETGGVEGTASNSSINQGALKRKAARRRPAASGSTIPNTQETHPSSLSAMESGMLFHQGSLTPQASQVCF